MSDEPKPLPEDTSFRALFGPNVDYRYFAQAGLHPFLAGATRFQLRNAWWCAEASLLVYVRDRAFVRERLGEAGLPDVFFLEDEPTGTQGFIAHNDAFVLVCFRGTEVDERADLETDARFRLVDFAVRGRTCRIHKGFRQAYESVHQPLTDHLAKLGSRPVWLTGHSLGGALATLAAHVHGEARGVYTFGSPRVGDRDFRNQYGQPTYRFVHNNDLVARVPPPGLIFLPYRHVGLLKYIDPAGRIHDNSGLWKELRGFFEGEVDHVVDLWRRWAAAELDAVAFDSLKDHAPMNYVVRIWNSYLEEIRELLSPD